MEPKDRTPQAICDFLSPALWGLCGSLKASLSYGLFAYEDGGIGLMLDCNHPEKSGKIPLFSKSELEKETYLREFGPRIHAIIAIEKHFKNKS